MARLRREVVVAVSPRSAMRVAVAMGVAGAVSITVATVCLVGLASATGVHRPIDRMLSAVQHGRHMSTSALLLTTGAGLAVIVLLGATLAGALVAIFANHVLPLGGGVVVEEEDPAPG
jgi:hypothetical protein